MYSVAAGSSPAASRPVAADPATLELNLSAVIFLVPPLSTGNAALRVAMTQVPFDIYAGLFSVAELADMAGIERPVVDVWTARGVLVPARRERPGAAKGKKSSARRGRPVFSCRDVFKARLVQQLFGSLAVTSRDASSIVEAAEEAPSLADKVAGGEWMYACARAIERGKSQTVYAYAARRNGKWQLDVHVGRHGAEPCFGWAKPHLFVPMSELFTDAYVKCKAVLGQN